MELFKHKRSAEYLRKFGSNLKEKKKTIISDISQVSQISPDNLTKEETTKLFNLQDNSDKIYREKLKKVL